ncbi:beta-1,3-glucanase family protein [Kitasatospora sp. NPDC048296]|uniref:beta-1,3-glucanase family protein n=1 Tax=Kitasatospora sp. NPDC048296 TaxID=3364048 RepID=UPI0037178012
MQADGSSLYHPPSPANDQTPLDVDCAIALNGPGVGPRGVTLPRLESGRIYFSVDAKLTFLMNRDGGLVLPSVSNPGDPNTNVRHGFCEFTYNNDQLYANITFVDLVCLPIAFQLETGQATQTVRGLPSDGLARVADALRAQSAADGSDWSRLIVSGDGGDLRVLSPNLAITVHHVPGTDCMSTRQSPDSPRRGSPRAGRRTADCPVRLVGSALAPEHRRGHGALNRGLIEIGRLRRSLARGVAAAGCGWPAGPGRGRLPLTGCGPMPPPATSSVDRTR